VFRSRFPTDPTNSVNKREETDTLSWLDSPPETLFFYLVTSPCVVNPPEICDGATDEPMR